MGRGASNASSWTGSLCSKIFVAVVTLGFLVAVVTLGSSQERSMLPFFFSDYFSCCKRLAAQRMGTMELAAETEVSMSMPSFSLDIYIALLPEKCWEQIVIEMQNTVSLFWAEARNEGPIAWRDVYESAWGKCSLIRRVDRSCFSCSFRSLPRSV